MEEPPRPPSHERFKKSLLTIFDVLSDATDLLLSAGLEPPIPKLLITLGKGAYGTRDATELIQKFISKTACHWDRIKKRDKDVLIENIEAMFEDEVAVKQHITSVNKLLGICLNKELGHQKGNADVESAVDDLVDTVWEILDACIKQCISHVHEMRCPQTVVTKSDDGSSIEKTSYTQKYYPDLSIKKLVEIWGARL